MIRAHALLALVAAAVAAQPGASAYWPREPQLPGGPAISFASARVGFAGGAHGLLATRDGGRTWRVVYRGLPIRALDAVGPPAWAISGQRLLATNDGTTSSLLPRSPILAAVDFLDRTNGFGFERSGHVLRRPTAGAAGLASTAARRGGRRSRASSRRLSASPSISSYSGPFSALGGGRAVFVGQCPACGRQPTVVVARTDDGGRTWRRRTVLDGHTPESLAFADARHGWLVTSPAHRAAAGGWIWRTTDGGRTWSLVERSPDLVAAFR
jgi:hypothetical protein